MKRLNLVVILGILAAGCATKQIYYYVDLEPTELKKVPVTGVPSDEECLYMGPTFQDNKTKGDTLFLYTRKGDAEYKLWKISLSGSVVPASTSVAKVDYPYWTSYTESTMGGEERAAQACLGCLSMYLLSEGSFVKERYSLSATKSFSKDTMILVTWDLEVKETRQHVGGMAYVEGEEMTGIGVEKIILGETIVPDIATYRGYGWPYRAVKGYNHRARYYLLPQKDLVSALPLPDLSSVNLGYISVEEKTMYSAWWDLPEDEKFVDFALTPKRDQAVFLIQETTEQGKRYSLYITPSSYVAKQILLYRSVTK
ncbi:MAG: hypothetical protein ACP5QG_07600 [candidate division WOR-3 bacterium]